VYLCTQNFYLYTMTYLLQFILILATQLTYFRIANHYNIIDKPNQRSSHTKVTLRGGGIVFYFSVLFYFLLQGFQYPWFLLGLTLIAGISFADDIKPQSSKLRLLIHFIAMAFMFYQLGLFELPWYFTLIALIVSTGILNAYNFMDGINGLTGGYSLVIVGALWYINTHQVSFIDNNLLYALMIALLIFNFFNFRKKANCFAGDVGAISIAFIIVFLLGTLILKTNNFSYIVLLALYGVDTVCTIVHRIALKENIFEAHRKHLYQIMANELKIPHVVVSGIYCLLQSLIVVGLVITNNPYWYLSIVVLILGVTYILFMLKFYRLHKSN